MKKLLLIIFAAFILVGCGPDMSNMTKDKFDYPVLDYDSFMDVFSKDYNSKDFQEGINGYFDQERFEDLEPGMDVYSAHYWTQYGTFAEVDTYAYYLSKEDSKPFFAIIKSHDDSEAQMEMIPRKFILDDENDVGSFSCEYTLYTTNDKLSQETMDRLEAKDFTYGEVEGYDGGKVYYKDISWIIFGDSMLEWNKIRLTI